MSYDIYLKDPVTGTTAEVPGHLMRGGTFKVVYETCKRRLFKIQGGLSSNK